jgi:hypothetical protein
MFDSVRKSLCLALAWFLVVVPTAQAQESTSALGAPVPAQILSAHSVFVSNGGGSNFFEMFTGGPDRAYNTLYSILQRSNRYQLVGAPAQADLIFEIRAVAPEVDAGRDFAYNPQLILSILDPKTSTVLWTTRANVRVLGRQKSRDRQFDQCVAVLVDKLGQVTGQPLSPEQSKAIRDNSVMRMPTAAKVFIFVGIAAAAAFAGYGAYRVTHPPSLSMPTLPAVR